MSVAAVRAYADWHNANPAYRAAGYPALSTHVAVLRASGQSPMTVVFNVAEGENPRDRLRAINSYARLESTIITQALADTALPAN